MFRQLLLLFMRGLDRHKGLKLHSKAHQKPLAINTTASATAREAQRAHPALQTGEIALSTYQSVSVEEDATQKFYKMLSVKFLMHLMQHLLHMLRTLHKQR